MTMSKVDVIKIQTDLNTLGFWPKLETRTGIFGPYSRSATMWFQTHWGIGTPSGEPDTATLDALAKAVGGFLKPVTKGFCGTVYGAGGSMLDPIGGMATINQKAAALGLKVAPQPYDYTDGQDVADRIRQFPLAVPIFLIGDSCGANRLSWIANAVAPRKVNLYAIQASVYCNSGCPPIGTNVDNALIIFSDWAHTGGLGVYIPPLAEGNKHTNYRQLYVPAIHPDDNDVLRVQNPIFADIKKILAAA